MNTIKISKFITIEADILLNHNLTSTDKIVYGFISALSNKTTECNASTKYLTKALGISSRQLRRCISKLHAYDYIDIKLIDNNKRVIKTKVDTFIEERAQRNNNQELIDYDWLNDLEV